MLFQAPAFHAAALLRHTGSPTPNATRLTHADLRCPVELLAMPLESSTMPVQSPRAPLAVVAHEAGWPCSFASLLRSLSVSHTRTAFVCRSSCTLYSVHALGRLLRQPRTLFLLRSRAWSTVTSTAYALSTPFAHLVDCYVKPRALYHSVCVFHRNSCQDCAPSRRSKSELPRSFASRRFSTSVPHAAAASRYFNSAHPTISVPPTSTPFHSTPSSVPA